MTGTENTSGPDGRRRVLKWLVGLLGGAAGAIAAIPVLGAVLFPVLHRTVREAEGFLDVAAEADLDPDAPARVAVRATRHDGWSVVRAVELGAVWLTRGRDGSIAAFSTVCPHLGCAVDWVLEQRTFNCPCHTSVFGAGGEVRSGPSPRPLDALESRVESGRVLVRFERYVPGRKDRVPA